MNLLISKFILIANDLTCFVVQKFNSFKDEIGRQKSTNMYITLNMQDSDSIRIVLMYRLNNLKI